MASTHEGRVAGRVPVGGVLAVVEQVLDQPRGHLALRIGPGEQLQVVGVGLVLAAVPVPPVPARQVEPGRLVLVVLADVLVDVPQRSCPSFSCLAFCFVCRARPNMAMA